MKTAMEERGLSASALARQAGVRRQLLYQWWSGESVPTRPSLARALRPLGLEVDAFLGPGPMMSDYRGDDPLILEMREMNRINAQLVRELRQLVQTYEEQRAAFQEEWLQVQAQTLQTWADAQSPAEAPTKLPRPRVQPSGTPGR